MNNARSAVNINYFSKAVARSSRTHINTLVGQSRVASSPVYSVYHKASESKRTNNEDHIDCGRGPSCDEYQIHMLF